MRQTSIFRRLTAALILLMPMTASAAEIAVTLPPLAGLVAMLEPQAEVACLLPAGADPHHFQLSPRKVEALQRSKLLIRAGADDAGWPLLPERARTLQLWPDTDHGWLNPPSVREALPLIAKALIRLHPKKRKSIDSALIKALQQTQDVEQAWRQALSGLGSAGVLMQHPSWRRLMQHMGVTVLAVLESRHHGHEMGPHKLESALTTLNRHPDAWLLDDAGHSNRALDWLAGHAVRPPHRITLDALGRCGLAWRELMQMNIDRIQDRQHP